MKTFRKQRDVEENSKQGSLLLVSLKKHAEYNLLVFHVDVSLKARFDQYAVAAATN